MSAEHCARGHAQPVHALDGGVRWPALAEMGLLCADCFHRLAYRLDDLPPLIRAARAEVVPDLGAGGSSEPVSGTKEKRLPFDVSALEMGDEMFSALANWTVALARTLAVDPPRELAKTYEADGNVNGLASWSSPAAAEDTAEGAVRWLLEHLAAAAALPVIADVYDGLVPLIEKAHRRWGDTDTKQRRSSRPCPSCGCRLVKVAWGGHEPSAWCADCLLRLPVDWTVLT